MNGLKADVEALQDFSSPPVLGRTLSSPTPGSRASGMTATSELRFSGSFNQSQRPHLHHGESTLRQRSKTVQAQHLVQFAGLGDVAGVQRCLEQGANPNVVAWGGITALMTAARHGREGVIECLLAHGADLDRTDSHGRTAVDHAFKSLGARALLISRGAPSSKELAAKAEAVAQRVIDMEVERQRLEVARDRMWC